MSVNDSVGRGDMIEYETASTTIEIATGKIAELDASGDVILPTTTPGNPVGVTATKVAARTTATQKNIVVQTSGLAHITCAANEAFGYNDMVISASANGYATTGPTFAGSTWGSEDSRKVVGRVITPDATTAGTTVITALNLR